MIKSWGTFDEGEMETKCNHCNKLDLLRQDLDQERTLDGNPFRFGFNKAESVRKVSKDIFSCTSI